MGTDRFVYWGLEKPTLQEIRHVLEDFLGGMATIEPKGRDLTLPDGETWLTVTLPGKPTNPFSRVTDVLPTERDERWFEVVNISDTNMDVITRGADWLTCEMATTFAKLCAKFWNAKYQDSEESIDYGIERIKELIKVSAIPEPGHNSFDDGLGPDTTFWLHTNGMADLERPDLEMVGVPAMWVGPCCKELNKWATHSLTSKIQDGHTLESHGALPVLLLAKESSNTDFWGGHPFGALTLHVQRVGFQCVCCQAPPEPNTKVH